MKDLIEYIARSIADNPQAVVVNEVRGETSVIIELRVAEEDKGKIIGRNGRVANAMRVLLKVASARQEKRAVLQII
ncbi:MAG: KH domain-containing protein [Chloroflexi bacterium]|nr:KH domain-containing protein [Chloroflexota bacterium]